MSPFLVVKMQQKPPGPLRIIVTIVK
jgi:hypothetical protein